MPKEKYITRRYSKKSDAGLRSWTPEIKIIFIMHEFLQETEKMKHFCFEVEKNDNGHFSSQFKFGFNDAEY